MHLPPLEDAPVSPHVALLPKSRLQQLCHSIFHSFAPNLFLALSMLRELHFRKSYMLPYIFKPKKFVFEVKTLIQIVHTVVTLIPNSCQIFHFTKGP